MRTFVSFQGTEGNAERVIDEVGATTSSELRVRVGERSVPVEVFEQGGRTTYVVGGKVVDLVADGAGAERVIIARGARVAVKLETERERLEATAGGGAAGSAEKLVKAPMPGRVVKVLVEAGQEVSAGQALLVVEAMKMENEVKAKGPGVVQTIHVATGATVEANAKLVTLA
jgi:biotin carboxyl carrier protein